MKLSDVSEVRCGQLWVRAPPMQGQALNTQQWKVLKGTIRNTVRGVTWVLSGLLSRQGVGFDRLALS